MFNKNIYKLGVFIDLSKAFGTADHNILLKQLSNYGIKNHTLDWYIYYLSNRKKFIGYNVNSKNNFFDVICGVQKGSFLGTSPFLPYMNDLPQASKLLEPRVFPEYINLYFSRKDIHSLFNTLNKGAHIKYIRRGAEGFYKFFKNFS